MDQCVGIPWTEAKDLAVDVGAFHAELWGSELLQHKVVNGAERGPRNTVTVGVLEGGA